MMGREEWPGPTPLAAAGFLLLFRAPWLVDRNVARRERVLFVTGRMYAYATETDERRSIISSTLLNPDTCDLSFCLWIFEAPGD